MMRFRAPAIGLRAAWRGFAAACRPTPLLQGLLRPCGLPSCIHPQRLHYPKSQCAPSSHRITLKGSQCQVLKHPSASGMERARGYGNINRYITRPSTTPVGLALGPDFYPGRIKPTGTRVIRRKRFLTLSTASPQYLHSSLVRIHRPGSLQHFDTPTIRTLVGSN